MIVIFLFLFEGAVKSVSVDSKNFTSVELGIGVIMVVRKFALLTVVLSVALATLETKAILVV